MRFNENVSSITAAECETGWVASNNSCYLVVREPVDYATAKSSCEEQAATLMSVGDAAENAFIEQM